MIHYNRAVLAFLPFCAKRGVTSPNFSEKHLHGSKAMQVFLSVGDIEFYSVCKIALGIG